MSLLQARCTNCGGELTVDDTKKAAVCQFCGEAFIVEEAVNNYITNHITNNTVNNNIGDGAVVNVYENAKSIPALLERVMQFLEDKDWDSADKYCEEILDMDPKNAQAYLGKLMAELHVQKKADLVRHKQMGASVNYQRALQYGDTSLQNELKTYLAEANDKNRTQEKIKKYQEYESKYQKEHKIWEDQVAAIKRECEKKANDKVSAEKEVLLADIESKYSNARDQLSAQLQSLKEEKATAESSLNALGLFAFSEKKNAKARIAELAAQIEKAEQQLKAAKQEFDSEKEKLARWEAEKREQLLFVMKDENPLPQEPVRVPIVLDDGTTMTAAQFENQCMIDLILEGMRPGIFYERTDLLELVSGFKKVSIQRIAAISNSMVECGYLQRVTEGGVVYFGLR